MVAHPSKICALSAAIISLAILLFPLTSEAKTGPSYTLSGEWKLSGVQGHQPAKTTYWTPQTGASAIWKPAFNSPVRAQVWIYKVVHTEGADPKVRIEIAHQKTTDTKYVDFTKGPSEWVNLGTYDFSGADSECVCLTKIAKSGNTRACAVRFDILSDSKNAAAAAPLVSILLDEPEALDSEKPPLSKAEFKDMAGHWARREIESLAAQGIIPVPADKTFFPDQPIKSEDFMQWLEKAQTYGSLTTLSAPVLSPNSGKNLTRETIALLLSQAAHTSGKRLDWLISPSTPSAPTLLITAPPSADAGTEKAPFALLEYLTTGSAGISAGASQPTRAEAAVLLHRFLKTVIQSGPPPHAKWEMTFREEFNGAGLDRDVWAVESGSPGHIFSSRWPENVEVKDGLLRLLTRKENRGGKEWTTGNIWTKTFKQQYGYFEARMRIAKAPGLNNAFWLMTQKKSTEPNHFEIDITEAHYPNESAMTLHKWSGTHTASGKSWRAPEDLSDDFNIYAAEWNENEIVWYFNGQEVRRANHDFCRDTAPLRLSSAVLRWAGRITDALDGTSMDVDWVRIYQYMVE
ncbi:MAG: family 16 glycosylhydrolase [Candidatus Sumerlaeota bacterium]|nr:family 16 glycosylhydrolase [Candidatus Sumerlaeota bacterium]